MTLSSIPCYRYPSISTRVSDAEVSVTETSVFSMPTQLNTSFKNINCTLPNTFSILGQNDLHSMSTSASASVSLLSRNFSTSTSITSSTNATSPALRSALNCKRATLYKGRKQNSCAMLPTLALSKSLPLLSLTYKDGDEDVDQELDYSESFNGSSCSSIPSLSTSDGVSLYSSQNSSSTLTLSEILDETHPLAEIETLHQEEEEKEKEEEPMKEKVVISRKHNPSRESRITSFLRDVKNLSIIKCAKSFYESNNLLVTNAATSVDLSIKDIVLLDALPLETFQTTYEPIERQPNMDSNVSLLNLRKSRECRINPNFLKFYAIDSTIKYKHKDQLLNDETIDFYQHQFMKSNCKTIDEFLTQVEISIDEAFSMPNPGNNTPQVNHLHKLIKYSISSRDKMWNKVVLQPRTDTFSNHKLTTSTSSMYVKTTDTNDGSLVRATNKIMPWFNLDDCAAMNKKCLYPRGILQNNVQYTAKNWANRRWTPVTA
jgi:hypothetical protein